MSRRSQVKRAARAKARAKQRAQSTQRTASGADAGAKPSGHARGHMPPPRLTPTGTDLLWEAHRGALWASWVAHAQAVEPASLAAQAEPLLTAWVRHCYGAGWQPTELIRFVAMRAKTGAADLVRLAVAAERDARSGPTATHPAWQQQWKAARLPAEALTPGWVARWAELREGWLEQLFRTAQLLGQTPLLDVLLPPPPGARVGTGHPHTASVAPVGEATSPALTRVRALLAKAESSQHESEAMAFTAKAQELMTKHALDQATLDAAAETASEPSMIRIPIDAPYLDSKALLLQTIAENSRCRTMFLHGVALSNIVGFPTDLAAVELLFTSLLVQAQSAIAEAGAIAAPGGRERSQAFRAAFLQGFTTRIGERLAAANQAAFDETEADAQIFLPVLRAQDARIEKFMEEHFRDAISTRVRGGFDAQGYHRGKEAAEAAALVTGALEG